MTRRIALPSRKQRCDCGGVVKARRGQTLEAALKIHADVCPRKR